MKITIFILSLVMAASVTAQDSTPPAPSTAEGWFKQKDVDQDGFLVQTEVTGTRTDTNFASYDTNQDGMLSFEEYEIGRNATEGPGGMGGGSMGGSGMGGAMSGS